MILSRTSQYAVQALIYMATQPAPRGADKDIAADLGTCTYLAKILQSLAKGSCCFPSAAVWAVSACAKTATKSP